MGVKLDKDLSVVEKKVFFIKIVNNFIAFDLDAWPKSPTAFSNLKIACLVQLV